MLTERNIVIAEDNAILRSLLTEIFRQCGWRVRAVENGFASLQAIAEELPAVLLSDLEMGGMSGFEMLSIVRRRFPSIRVVAMSGAFRGSDVPTGVAADCFYAKGGSVSTLLDLVAELCGKQLAELRRTEVPIWFPLHLATSSPNGCLGIACSNCLRSVYRDGPGSESDEELTCPYCNSDIRVSFLEDSAASTGVCGSSKALLPWRMQTAQRAVGGATC